MTGNDNSDCYIDKGGNNEKNNNNLAKLHVR